MASEKTDSPSSVQPRSSLYANLLSSDTFGASPGQTISRAPVVFSQANGGDGPQDDAAAKKNAALRFQPTKRHTPAQKAKTKPAFSKGQGAQISSDSVDQSATAVAPPPAKSTLADWTADDDDVNGFYVEEKRQRGGRKKRKKNKVETVVVQDWDDIYDPSRPNNYEDYRQSEEKYREIKEWKDRLYAHRFNKKRGSSELSDHSGGPAHHANRTFAPPPNYSFAPPPTSGLDSQEKNQPPVEHIPPPSPPPTVDVPDDATGEDAYARRMRLSGTQAPTATPSPPPPPEPATEPAPLTLPQSRPSAAQPAPTIARAPVRYQLPSAPADIPSSEAELDRALAAQNEDLAASNPKAPDTDADVEADGDTGAARSNRPGQRGFAARLMSKYGWTKGSGLGAEGTGIINPLRVQVEKRKKKSDAEGGGYTGPAGKGKIIGSQPGRGGGGGNGKDGAAPDAGTVLSEVVVLRGMVDGLDLDAEMGEGGLMQEIGEECGDKYGRVERVFIDRASAGSVPVFIKFTSQLSALRAVQALEGRIFNGNTIQARYFDPEKFEAGIYE